MSVTYTPVPIPTHQWGLISLEERLLGKWEYKCNFSPEFSALLLKRKAHMMVNDPEQKLYREAIERRRTFAMTRNKFDTGQFVHDGPGLLGAVDNFVHLYEERAL